eukprot:899270-Pelagomonas_calceolata.AAC.2
MMTIGAGGVVSGPGVDRAPDTRKAEEWADKQQVRCSRPVTYFQICCVSCAMTVCWRAPSLALCNYCVFWACTVNVCQWVLFWTLCPH